MVFSQSRQAAGAHVWVKKMSNVSRFGSSRLAGRAPLKPQFSNRFSDLRFVRFSSHIVEPVNSFLWRSSPSRLARFPRAAGIGPVNSFHPSRKVFRFTRRPSSTGIGPVNAFTARDSHSRLARLPRAAGIGLVNSFPARVSDSRFRKLPSSPGIAPINAFEDKNSHRTFVRAPRSLGIEPVKSLSWRSIPQTRPWCIVTPCHSSNGASVFQFVLTVQFGPSVASYSASSAARSVAGLP